MAKARKTVRKTAGGGRKAAAAQGKTAGRKKVAARKAGPARKKPSAGRKKKTPGTGSPASELDLTALKKQIREHVNQLQGARTSDRRVADALASLQRVYSELESSCGSTMVIPLA